MLLLAGELHPHRRTHRAGQQGGIGGDIVGAIAAIATGGLHAHHGNVDLVQAHQLGQVGAQHMRALGAGPNGEPRFARHRLWRPQGQSTRRPNRRVHLIRPHIGARQALRGLGHGGVHIAVIDQAALGGRVGAQSLLQVAQGGQARPVFPLHAQFAHGLFGVFFALGHHTDKVANHHHRAHAGDVGDRRLVHRQQGVADEVAMVGTHIRRAHHAAMQHAGHAHVVHKQGLAGDFGRYVQALHRLANEPVFGSGFERCAQRQAEGHMLTCQHIGIAALACGVGAQHDHTGLHVHVGRRSTQALGRTLEQPSPGLCGTRAQGGGVHLQRCAGNGRPLVRCQGGAAQHHMHIGQGHIQFFGHHLRQRGADARAQIHMAMQGGDAAVVPHGEQNFHAFGWVAGHRRRLAFDRGRRWWWLTGDEQHPSGRMEVGAALGLGGAARHVGTPCMRCAANITA